MITLTKTGGIIMSIEKSFYGTDSVGEDVYKYSIENINNVRAEIITYGATLTNLFVPDKNGDFADILIGFDDINGHETRSDYQGMVVGRYANRIAEGKFTIDSVEYEIPHNEGKTCLHGGGEFSHAIWKAIIVDDNKLELSYTSPDMENGFPGELKVTVTYTLTDANELVLEYRAVSSKKTIMNFTNHAYFNLGGFDAEPVTGHILQIDADFFTPIDDDSIPTGELRPVGGTPFDFREPKEIGKEIHADYDQLVGTKGYDHNFCLNKKNDRSANIRVTEPKSGRIMEVYTDLPGVQLYCGNFLDGIEGKGSTKMNQHSGFCLETQFYPDTPNHPDFPSCTFDAKKEFRTTTKFRFFTEDK